MAFTSYSFSGSPNHFIDLIYRDVIQLGSATTTQSNSFVTTYVNGPNTQTVEVSGSGFTYNANGLASGTVTNFSVMENGNVLQSHEGFSRTAAQFQQLSADFVASVPNAFATFVGSENGNFTGSALGDSFNFGDGDDVLNGGDGDDVLLGLGGNDTINGGNGLDRITGGAGDDTINPGDNMSGDIVIGGFGTDTIVYSDSSFGFQTLDYGSLGNSITITIDGVGNTATVNKGGAGADTIIDLKKPLDAGSGTIGGVGIHGTGGSDTFNINTDIGQWIYIRGGGGADSYIVSGSGLVRLDFNAAFAAGVHVDLGLGSVLNDGFGNTENITGQIWEVRGTSFTDTLIGSAADESFIGREGDDTIDGGDGFDRVRYDRFGIDAVVVDLFNGIATGTASGIAFSHTLSNLEWIRGSRNDDDRLYGSSNDEKFEGRGGDDIIRARGGQDELLGEAGNDSLYGGSGDDLLEGGEGDDLLNGDGNGPFGDTASYMHATATVTVSLNLQGLSQITGAAGTDTLNDIENLIGGLADDVLIGDSTDNFFEGNAGNDMINGGSGIDTAVYQLALDPVTIDLHIGRSYGGGGNDRLLSIENAVGSEYSDILRGNALNGDLIDGAGGNDVLVGRGGIDTMFGGEGDDRFFVQQNGDQVVEFADEGHDEVRVYFDGYTLADNVEELRVIANAHIAYGNGLDNVIAGGAGADKLHGRGGNDLINGNGGGDMLFGESGDDRLIGSNGADMLNGGGGDDRLEGSGDIDTLDGSSGNDFLFGGGGRDFMTGGNGSDRFIFDDADYGGNTFSTADRVLDFSQSQNDLIDLRPTDADTGTVTDDAFSFIDANAFSGTAGELRTLQSGGRTYVQGDTDGDGNSDFHIRLEGLIALDTGDFLL